MDEIQNTIQDAKDTLKDALPNAVPTPPQQVRQPQANVNELKSRLEWGEPALTIVDVSDRNTFNNNHILGAVTMPLDRLVEIAQSTLEFTRDIYIYGATAEETATAADYLRSAGFTQVSELKGGFAAWKAIDGPTDGVNEAQSVVPKSAYNLVDRLKKHSETQRAAQS